MSEVFPVHVVFELRKRAAFPAEGPRRETFRGGLVFKAHGLVYHSTLGWRVIKKKKQTCLLAVSCLQACRGERKASFITGVPRS